MKRTKANTEAVAFFRENAGFSYDPKTETKRQGKERCAREYAAAEVWAKDNDLTVIWEHDSEGCIGCDCDNPECDCSTGADHETFWACLRDTEGEHLASLSCICKPDSNYRRVVEAELASEAMTEAERAIATKERNRTVIAG